jgi:hypothetical protein
MNTILIGAIIAAREPHGAARSDEAGIALVA